MKLRNRLRVNLMVNAQVLISGVWVTADNTAHFEEGHGLHACAADQLALRSQGEGA